MKNIFKTIEILYWGANIRLLWMCPKERVTFVRNELFIIALSGYTIIATGDVTDGWGYLCGIGVFLLYKWFLSSPNVACRKNNHSFGKWLVSTLIAVVLTYCTSEEWMYIRWDNPQISDIITLMVILILLLVCCYYPVRFRSMRDSQYEKLLIEANEAEEKNSISQLRKQKEDKKIKDDAIDEIIRLADKDYQMKVAREIADARTRIAKRVIEKWEKEQMQLVEKDIHKFIGNEEKK